MNIEIVSQPSQNISNQLVIFLHIPKTAGTTLYDVLKNQYGRNNILSFHGIVEENLEKFENLYLEKKDRIQLIKGHMTFGLHQYLDSPSTYITMIRHPVKRMISVYNYLIQSPYHPQHSLVKNKTLEEFILSKTIHNNHQTRLLAGQYKNDERCPQKEDILTRAKKNIEEKFLVVGLSERFDETIILLKRTLNWAGLPCYIKQNKSKKTALNSLTTKTLNLIQDLNFLDMELYRYAQEVFEKQLEAQGDSFEFDLKQFRLANKIYHPIGAIYSETRFLALKLMGHF